MDPIVESNLAQTIEDYIASSKVMIFSKTSCPLCQQVKSLFYKLNVKFFVLEIDTHKNGPELQEAMAAKVGRSSVPQVFICGKPIGGCDDIMVKFCNGTLEDMLGIKKYGSGSGGFAASKFKDLEEELDEVKKQKNCIEMSVVTLKHEVLELKKSDSSKSQKLESRSLQVDELMRKRYRLETSLADARTSLSALLKQNARFKVQLGITTCGADSDVQKTDASVQTKSIDIINRSPESSRKNIIQTEFANGNLNFKCWNENCSYFVTIWANLKRHLSSCKYAPEPILLQCHVYKLSFESLSLLTSHLKADHNLKL